MKYAYSLLFILCTVLKIKAQCVDVVNIPDVNFKAALLANTEINTNGDTEISCYEASSFKSTVNVEALGITDLTGIEAFEKVRFINCNNNNLTSIDVSNNLELEYLSCTDNELTTIDVSNNLKLLHLIFNNNLLRNIDISKNLNLFSLGCSSNRLTNLDFSNNSRLATLGCASNMITELDLSLNRNLKFFVCNDNKLTSLNLANGNNVDIELVVAYQNPLLGCIEVDDVVYSTTTWKSIDLNSSFSTDCSNCFVNIPDVNFKTALVNNTEINTNGDTEISCSEAVSYTRVIDVGSLGITDLTGIEAFSNITRLECDNNALTSLDVSNNRLLEIINCSSNNFIELDVSKNTNLLYFICTSTSLEFLNIANGNNENISFFLANQNPNLTCIEVDDIAYSTLAWTSIDITANYSVDCAACFVEIPDINFKTALINNVLINTDGDDEISCTEAEAYTGTIDVSGLSITNLTGIEAFINITELECENNDLTELDLSKNTLLEFLDCSSNNMFSLDLSTNINLTYFVCTSTSLRSLNIANGNNENISIFLAFLNPLLTCIEVDDVDYSTSEWFFKDATASYSIDCSACFVNIPDTNFKAALVGDLLINTDGDNEISCDEAEAYTGTINVGGLSIVNLTGIEAFINLTELECDNNPVTSINLSMNTRLTSLNCSSTTLLDLDLSNNSELTYFLCSSTSLESLNIANGNNEKIALFFAIQNPNLTCIKVDNVAYSTSEWIFKDAIANYTTNCSLNISSNAITSLSRTTKIISYSDNAISVYPNPVQNILNINVEMGSALEQVDIFNVSGKKIMSSKENTINVDTLLPGVYMLNLVTKEGNVVTKKILKK